MTELFANIPDHIKQQAKAWVDLALHQINLFDGAKMIKEYHDSCFTEEEKEFVDFYFRMRMEQLKNESNSNISEKPAR
jgi:hypothetical protein